MTVSAAEGSLVIDLAVDTSAEMAVLLREPGAEAVLERLCKAVQPAVAAPTRTEILLVAFLDQQAFLSVAWDGELADQAAQAFARFGKGRHASGLNFGDCLSKASGTGRGAESKAESLKLLRAMDGRPLSKSEWQQYLVARGSQAP
jgi:ribonuclease VapC